MGVLVYRFLSGRVPALPIIVDDVIGDVTDDDSCRRNAVNYGLLVLVLINKLLIVSDCLLCVKLDHQAATDCLCCSYPRSRSVRLMVTTTASLNGMWWSWLMSSF